MNISAEDLNIFIRSMKRTEDEFLCALRSDCEALGIPLIRYEMEGLLEFLIRLKRPCNILEVGSAVGYSAIFMGGCMPEGARIKSIESDRNRYERARENVDKAGLSDRIELINGDAGLVLGGLCGAFDFIFMDAAKAQYINWLPDVVRLLSCGGVLVTDNVLQEGDVLESRFAVSRRNRTIHSRMRSYLDALMNTEGLYTAILNVGDGAALTLRRCDEK